MYEEMKTEYENKLDFRFEDILNIYCAETMSITKTEDNLLKKGTLIPRSLSIPSSEESLNEIVSFVLVTEDVYVTNQDFSAKCVHFGKVAKNEIKAFVYAQNHKFEYVDADEEIFESLKSSITANGLFVVETI